MAAEANATQEQEQEQEQQQQMSQEEYQQRLKYLEFVQAATLQLVGCFAGVYDYAKSNSGPLKPGVQTVEGTVKTVVGPVYEKFHAVPLELLKLVDRKVDFSVHEIERRVPSLVKEGYTAAQKAPQVAQAVASEVQRSGVVGSATGAAKTAYSKYEPVAEQYAATAWHKLNKLPLFPQVAHAVLPTAAYCTERYNSAVCYTAEKGYTVSSYLPLVPVERIAKVFGSEEDAVEPAVNAPSGGEIAVA